LVGIDIADRKIASVKLLFRNAAHSERPHRTGLEIAKSMPITIGLLTALTLSEKVRIQGWYGEPNCDSG
jgi:hypothetical protein